MVARPWSAGRRDAGAMCRPFRLDGREPLDRTSCNVSLLSRAYVRRQSAVTASSMGRAAQVMRPTSPAASPQASPLAGHPITSSKIQDSCGAGSRPNSTRCGSWDATIIVGCASPLTIRRSAAIVEPIRPGSVVPPVLSMDCATAQSMSLSADPSGRWTVAALGLGRRTNARLWISRCSMGWASRVPAKHSANVRPDFRPSTPDGVDAAGVHGYPRQVSYTFPSGARIGMPHQLSRTRMPIGAASPAIRMRQEPTAGKGFCGAYR